MAGNAKPNITGLRHEARIHLNSSYVRFNDGIANAYNDISALFDGQSTTVAPYGAVLITKITNNFIDFTCNETFKIWCIGATNYSDGGGSAPQSINIDKWNGSKWIAYAERPTSNNGVWYDLTGKLDAGRYKITAKADYISMDEWYVENQQHNKILISSTNKYYSITPTTISNTNSIPVMTSNTMPSGVASSSTDYSTAYQAWKAFNGTTVDAGDCWVTANNILTGWLQYKFDTPKNIEQYAVISRNSANRGDLKTWTFEGSNDGVSWETLDTRNNESAWNANEKREYEVKVKFGSYMYYRINVTETTLVSATYLSIGELLFYETSTPEMIKIESYDESDFNNYGAFEINPNIPITRIKDVVKTSTSLGNGKVFSHQLELEKNKTSRIFLGE